MVISILLISTIFVSVLVVIILAAVGVWIINMLTEGNTRKILTVLLIVAAVIWFLTSSGVFANGTLRI